MTDRPIDHVRALATKVYEDDTLCAFLDIRPIARGHTLVVPKRHATELEDLDPDTGAGIYGTTDPAQTGVGEA